MAIAPDQRFTAIIRKDADLYVGLCPELDIASQGDSIEQALVNLQEAVALFLDAADSKELQAPRRGPVFVTQFLATHG